MSAPRLVVVVVNWNAAADTVTCVRALQEQLSDDDEVVVVDNGSRAEEREALRALTGVTLLQNEQNLGFAGATNAGVRHAMAADARWVLWWNNDALPHPGAIDALLGAAERLQLDAAQPLLLTEETPARIDSAGLFAARGLGAFDWLRGELPERAPRTPTPILGPCGAAALFRVETLRAAGLMDDELFVMCEDLDQALRLRKIGGEATLVPDAVATHRRGVSGRPATPSLRRLRKLWLQRNSVAIGLRDWPLWQLVLHAPTICWRVAQALWLAGGSGFRCLPLWRAALRARGPSRRAMRSHAVERFLLPGGRRGAIRY